MRKGAITMKFILLLILSLSFLNARIINNHNGTVTDTATHLQWQDTQANQTDTRDWANAISYCQNLSLDGYTNWRLPNVNELKSLLNYSKDVNSIVSGFKYYAKNPPRIYWTSTSVSGLADYAWVVNFNYGSVIYYHKSGRVTSYYRVRCVRNENMR